MARGIYTVNTAPQTFTAVTALEITAPATAVLEILKAWASSDTNTDAVNRVQLLRKSASITGTASPPTPRALDVAAASGVTVKWKASAEGTDGNILYDDYVHVKNGWIWVPVKPQSRIIVPPSGIIAIKFPVTPATGNWSVGMEFEEIG